VKKKIQCAFFGTPELTLTVLDELARNGYMPEVIVTMPDRPSGRKMVIAPPPTKVWAESHGIPTLQPEKIDEEFLDAFAKYDVNLGIVVAYGKILPQKLLDMPAWGMINIHYSLLPKYRGATPVESAILAGEDTTGVSIQKIEFKLDSGPLLAKEETAIHHDETAPALRSRLNDMAKVLLIATIRNIEEGKARHIPQNEGDATFSKKIKKEDGLVDLADDPFTLWRKYKAYYAWPKLYFFKEERDGKKRVIITKASFVDGSFVIEKVTPENKKEMDYSAYQKSLKHASKKGKEDPHP